MVHVALGVLLDGIERGGLAVEVPDVLGVRELPAGAMKTAVGSRNDDRGGELRGRYGLEPFPRKNGGNAL